MQTSKTHSEILFSELTDHIKKDLFRTYGSEGIQDAIKDLLNVSAEHTYFSNALAHFWHEGESENKNNLAHVRIENLYNLVGSPDDMLRYQNFVSMIVVFMSKIQEVFRAFEIEQEQLKNS